MFFGKKICKKQNTTLFIRGANESIKNILLLRIGPRDWARLMSPVPQKALGAVLGDATGDALTKLINQKKKYMS
jgi:hypothetical protein